MQLAQRIFGSICLALLVSSSIAVSAASSKKISDEDLQKAVVDYNNEVSDKDDEVVCKKVAITGSRHKKRVCKTRGLMKEEREQARRLRNRKSGSDAGGGGGSGVQ